MLVSRDKFTLNLARELLSRVGCGNPYDPDEVTQCWCSGRCKSPLALELRALIADLDARHKEAPEHGKVESFPGGAFTWPVGWPVRYWGPRG